VEGSAALGVGSRPEVATVGLDNRATDRESVPWDFVVKNASKILSIWSRGSPTPVSLTEINSKPPESRCDLMVSVPDVFQSLIASIALSARFMKTCCN
jgi:hypothetical protein